MNLVKTVAKVLFCSVVLLVCVRPSSLWAQSDKPADVKIIPFGSGSFQCQYSIPASEGSCSLANVDKASWKLFSPGLGSFQGLTDWLQWMEGYAKVLSKEGASLVTETYASPLFGAWGCPAATAKATYDCSAKAAAPAPDPTPQPKPPSCEKKEWFRDFDYDGVGWANESVWSCNKPHDVVVHSWGPYPEHKNTWTTQCCDKCDDVKGLMKPLTWCWDWDLDGNGSAGAKKIVSCVKPAPDPGATQGQWVNQCTDACDTDKKLSQTNTWCWDHDGDTDGNPLSKTGPLCTPPAAWKNDPFGKWVATSCADNCDDAPGFIAKQTWYWDGDGDGEASASSPTEISCGPPTTVPPAKPKDQPKQKEKGKGGSAQQEQQAAQGGSKTVIAGKGKGQWVAKKGTDECDENPGAVKKQTYYKDQDGDGYPGMYADKLIPQDFCSLTEASAAGYTPKRNDGKTDECDDQKKIIKKQFFCIDADHDGWGDSKNKFSQTLCSLDPPNDQYVGEAQCGDCDDEEKNILNEFVVYQDKDGDGFGDPFTGKVLNCTSEDPQAYTEGKDGWVANQQDLADIRPSPTMYANIKMNPSHLFALTVDGQTGKAACRYYTDTLIECLPGDYYVSGACPNLLGSAAAELNFGEIVPYEISPQPSLDFLLNCMVSAGNPMVFFRGSGVQFVAINLHPLGKMILPMQGTDFLVDFKFPEAALELPPYAINFLFPYITWSLKDLPGIIPVRYANQPDTAQANDPQSIVMARKILFQGALGPLISRTIPTEVYTKIAQAAVPLDFFVRPLLRINTAADSSVAHYNDSDHDFLPNDFEKSLGMNPDKNDTDHDGAPDGVEWILAGGTANAATDGKAVLLPTSTEWTINTPITPEELEAFQAARIKAHQLVTATIERMMELYGEDTKYTLNPDQNLMHLLIDDATSGIVFAIPPGNNLGELYTILRTSHLGVYDLPFPTVTRNVYGHADGCGIDGKSICIDLPLFKLRVFRIVENLLHEALHHLITPTSDDPGDVQVHVAIAAILGGGDFLYTND